MPQTLGHEGPRSLHLHVAAEKLYNPCGSPGKVAPAIIPFKREDPIKVHRSAANLRRPPFSAGPHQPKTTPPGRHFPSFITFGVKGAPTYTKIHLNPQYIQWFPPLCPYTFRRLTLLNMHRNTYMQVRSTVLLPSLTLFPVHKVHTVTFTPWHNTCNQRYNHSRLQESLKITDFLSYKFLDILDICMTQIKQSEPWLPAHPNPAEHIWVHGLVEQTFHLLLCWQARRWKFSTDVVLFWSQGHGLHPGKGRVLLKAQLQLLTDKINQHTSEMSYLRPVVVIGISGHRKQNLDHGEQPDDIRVESCNKTWALYQAGRFNCSTFITETIFKNDLLCAL